MRAAKSVHWIRELDLKTAFTRLLALQQASPIELDGVIMAAVVGRLVECELAPGGPYMQIDTPEPEANKLIYRFMINQGVRLAPLEDYLKTHYKELLAQKPEYGTPGGRLPVQSGSVFKAAVSMGLDIPVIATRKVFTEQIARIQRADVSGKIALLSQMFNNSLSPRYRTATEEDLLSLGVVNVLSWVAYTIYDNIIDDRLDCQLTPVANFTGRKAIAEYCRVAALLGADELILEHSFTQMDYANMWELEHCRLAVSGDTVVIGVIPNFRSRKVLADRALAHIAGPLALIEAANKVTQQQKSAVHTALDHYLIARQLNDDAHDWRQDLASGQMTYVLSVLLKLADITPGTYASEELCIRLQNIFWNKGLVAISETIVSHVHASRKLLHDSQLFMEDSAIHKLLSTIELSATRSILLQSSQRDFLANISNNLARVTEDSVAGS